MDAKSRDVSVSVESENMRWIGMKYTKIDFEGDLFFWIGYLDVCVNRSDTLNKERFNEFKKYCLREFANKRGMLK